MAVSSESVLRIVTSDSGGDSDYDEPHHCRRPKLVSPSRVGLRPRLGAVGGFGPAWQSGLLLEVIEELVRFIRSLSDSFEFEFEFEYQRVD